MIVLIVLASYIAIAVGTGVIAKHVYGFVAGVEYALGVFGPVVLPFMGLAMLIDFANAKVKEQKSKPTPEQLFIEKEEGSRLHFSNDGLNWCVGTLKRHANRPWVALKECKVQREYTSIYTPYIDVHKEGSKERPFVDKKAFVQYDYCFEYQLTTKRIPTGWTNPLLDEEGV